MPSRPTCATWSGGPRPTLEQLAARRGTRIDFRLPAEPCVAEVDRRRVERMLRNLLDNAVEHGEGRDVVVTVAGDRDAVAIAVRDHGSGFGPNEAQLVFDRFWRADPARARTTGGTGLGLAIALEDARLHNGWLQAWGEHSKGSVFRLTLPRVCGEQLIGSPLPLGPDAAEPGPELVHSPLVLHLDDGIPRPSPAPASPPPTRTARPRQAPPMARRHPLLRWLVVALAALATVAGCAEVPVSGPLQSSKLPASVGGQQQGTRCCGQIMSPPQPGWSPTQMVLNFIVAGSDFTEDHAIARQYLTAAANASWRPGPGPAVTVIATTPDVSPELPPQLNSQKTEVVEITAKELGAVNSTGQYIPAPDGQKPLTQRFGLKLVGHQWRIDSLPGLAGRVSRELLLSKDFFQLAYQPRNLYYFDPSYKNLVPDPVFLPVNTADPATVLVNALLAEPQGWLESAAYSGFPGRQPPRPDTDPAGQRRPPSST